MQSPTFCVKLLTFTVIILRVSLYVLPFVVASSRLQGSPGKDGSPGISGSPGEQVCVCN